MSSFIMTVCLNLYPFDHDHIENISERNGVIAAKKHTSVIVNRRYSPK